MTSSTLPHAGTGYRAELNERPDLGSVDGCADVRDGVVVCLGLVVQQALLSVNVHTTGHEPEVAATIVRETRLTASGLDSCSAPRRPRNPSSGEQVAQSLASFREEFRDCQLQQRQVLLNSGGRSAAASPFAASTRFRRSASASSASCDNAPGGRSAVRTQTASNRRPICARSFPSPPSAAPCRARRIVFSDVDHRPAGQNGLEEPIWRHLAKKGQSQSIRSLGLLAMLVPPLDVVDEFRMTAFLPPDLCDSL